MSPKRSKTPLRKKPRWQFFYAGLILGLFSTISLGRFGVGPRIGDGTGFYVMFFLLGGKRHALVHGRIRAEVMKAAWHMADVGRPATFLF